MIFNTLSVSNLQRQKNVFSQFDPLPKNERLFHQVNRHVFETIGDSSGKAQRISLSVHSICGAVDFAKVHKQIVVACRYIVYTGKTIVF